MAEQTPRERPVRRYVIPRNTSRLVVWSAAAAALVLGVAVVLSITVWPQLASPGPLASVHAPIDATCAQCHQPAPSSRNTDLRCERCHDPLDSRRFGVPAHVLVATDDAWKSTHAPAVTCGGCHVEHQGGEAALRVVADRTCETCHGFRSFASHPPFALVASGAPSETGIDFSHPSHLKTLVGLGSGRCEVCHEPTADHRTFQPLSFDRHCARCHLKNDRLTLNGKDPLPSGNLRADLVTAIGAPAGRLVPSDTAPGRSFVAAFAHRDPWVLDRVARLATLVDSQDAIGASRRARISSAIAAADLAESLSPLPSLSADELAQWTTDLEAEVAAIDRQLATPAAALPADATATLNDIAAMVAPGATGLTAPLTTTAPGRSPLAQDRASGAEIDARREELTQLLAAIDASGDPRAVEQAKELRRRLETLDPSSASAAPNRSALLDRLGSLEAAIAVVEQRAGAIRGHELRSLAAATGQALESDITAPEFAQRQAELHKLLTALEAGADPALRRRLSDLRLALARLDRGDRGETALRARRDERARLLARVRLHQELTGVVAGPSAALIRSELAALRNARTLLQVELANANRPAPAPLPGALDRTAAAAGIQSLLAACLTCHRMNADGTGLAPVRATLDQLRQANFSHKPHISQAPCESCHSGVDSGLRGQVLLPNVDRCQACHAAGRDRSSCATCHTFHTRSMPVPRAGSGQP